MPTCLTRSAADFKPGESRCAGEPGKLFWLGEVTLPIFGGSVGEVAVIKANDPRLQLAVEDFRQRVAAAVRPMFVSSEDVKFELTTRLAITQEEARGLLRDVAADRDVSPSDIVRAGRLPQG